MTNEEAIEVLKHWDGYFVGHSSDDVNKALMMAIQALEQQPRTNLAKTSQDCISRTELLAKIDEERKHLLELKMDGAEHIIVHHARRIIEDMPPVTPQYTDEEIDKIQAVEQAYVDKMVELAVEETRRPKGKWIRIAGFEDCNYDKCSVCGVYQLFYYGKPSTNYCPNCGVEMEVENNVS